MRNVLTGRTRSSARAAVGLVAATVLAACSVADSPTAPLTAAGKVANHTETTGYVRVCKSAGPAGTYTFSTVVEGGGAHHVNFGSGPTMSIAFAGEETCLNTYGQFAEPAWTEGQTGTVTISELVPDGIEVAEIQVWQFGVFPPVLLQTITGSNSVTLTVNSTSQIKVLYFNREFIPPPPPPPPMGGEGCTPGYWKQSQHFDSWTGLTPGQSVGSVFSNAALFDLDAYTLLQGLQSGGGGTLKDAAKTLLRAAIAAVLNANSANVDYYATSADIVAQVNAALASNSRNTILALKDTLDLENNRGCDLN
ncbi:MAG TPA: hypothetical protein VEB19_11710 [Gemmatimonadaceae bacterium]|nr:hypothetical protein [Gemmatimonadaceae bacterium]